MAISDNLKAMASKCHRQQNKPHQGKKPPAVCTHVDTAQSPTHLANLHVQHRMTYAMDVARKDTGSPNAKVDIKDLRTRHLNTTTEEEDKKVNEVGIDEDPHCDEVGVVTVVLQTSPHKE